MDATTGLSMDASTGLLMDASTGLPMDASTGLSMDASTGLPMDVFTGLNWGPPADSLINQGVRDNVSGHTTRALPGRVRTNNRTVPALCHGHWAMTSHGHWAMSWPLGYDKSYFGVLGREPGKR